MLITVLLNDSSGRLVMDNQINTTKSLYRMQTNRMIFFTDLRLKRSLIQRSLSPNTHIFIHNRFVKCNRHFTVKALRHFATISFCFIFCTILKLQ